MNRIPPARISPLFIVIAMLLALCPMGCRKAPSFTPSLSVLRVTSTIRLPDARRPWLKKPPFTRIGLGTLIGNGRILVTADMVAHAADIALERPEDGPKGTATVEALDEECNLAVLKPSDPSLLEGMRPLKLAPTAHAGETLSILQLEANGASALSPATVTTVSVLPYPSDGASCLAYRVSTTIPQREGSFVIPALLKGKLAGLVMRYDPRTQSADLIPSPLIARFLEESPKPDYRGLARLGLTWDQVRGNSLRKWIGAEKFPGGVYVTSTDPDGPAEKGGILAGDLLVTVDGKSLDGEGNVSDPELGKVNFSNLASLGHVPGDQMVLGYFRSSGEESGAFGSATVTLTGRNSSAEIIPLRIEGDRIPYRFLGGLLFQELSRPYLKEWGSNWRSEAPQNLVALDAFQTDPPRKRRRVVILSEILPSPQTIGQQDLANRVVESVNGRAIHSLDDLAEAVRNPSGGFHRIDLDGSAGPIFLETEGLEELQNQLMKQYGIPSEHTP